MEDRDLDVLLDLIQSGENIAGIDNIDSLRQIVENEGVEVLFRLMPEGAVSSPAELGDLFPAGKKKGQSQIGSQLPSSNMASTSRQDPEEPQLESGQEETAEDFISQYDPNFIPERITGARYGSNYQQGEKDTWLERTLGKNFITDYFGDIYRAGSQGIKQGATLDDALKLFVDGANTSSEDIQEYLRVVQEADNVGVSDEMRRYNQIYEEAGKGPWGVIKGLFLTRGQIIPQVLTSSVFSMLNPTAAAGAGAGAAATGAAAAGVGAIAGSIGTPVGSAIAGAVSGTAGAIAGTFGGASAILETGLTFTELLKEEVEKLGLEFDEEGVLETLSSPGVLQSLRNRSAGRGLTIGVIDGIARGTVGQLVLKPAKQITKAGKMLSRAQKANNALKAAGIEGLGGSLGETLGRVVAGQEMDASEIALEGIVGNTSALVTVPQAVTGKTVVELVGGKKAQAKVDKVTADVNKKVKAASGKVYDFTIGKQGLNVFKLPKYGVKNKAGNVTEMTKKEIVDMVTTMTPEDIRTAQFEVKNDPELQEYITDQKEAAQLELNLPDYIQGENRAETIRLEMELRNINDPTIEANKIREKEIKTRLAEIAEKSKTDTTTSELATQNTDPVKKETYETVDDNGDKNIITVTTAKDGSRKIQLKDKDGQVYNTERVGKNNDITNEKFIENIVAQEGSDIVKTETIEGFENIANPKAVARRKQKLGIKTETTPAPTQSAAEVRNLAVDQLKADGIIDPTEQQITEKANAIQESSATQVDVQESTEDSTAVGEGDTTGVPTPEGPEQTQGTGVPIETQTQEEISVNVAPFFETSIESTAEAGGVRKTPQYKKYKQSLQDLADDIGVEVEVEESVGGYVNEAGTKIREVSNVVKLKNATLDQASEYAALAAALAPEVQESSIAAEYTTKGAENHNGNEITIKVSDSEATFQALQEAGIDEYTLNESNNLLTLLDIFDFSDPEADLKFDRLIDILDSKNVTYEVQNTEAINSKFIGASERKQILSARRQSAIEQQQEGSNLYKKIVSAINRDAEKQGISPNEYIAFNPNQITDSEGNIINPVVKEYIKEKQKRRVRDIAQKIKQKILGRRPKSMNPAYIVKQVTEYLKQTKLAEQLNDIEFDALVRKVSEDLGVKAPRRATIQKAFKLAEKNNRKLAAINEGKNNKTKAKPDKKVVVNERVALKDQIKMQAKAAIKSVKAYKTFLKNVTAQVKSLKKSGKLSAKQATILTDRLASITPFSQKSVDNYLKYVDKVFTKADYVNKVTRAKALAKRAKTNIAKKIGVVQGDLKTALQNVFALNPYAIPDAQLDNYISLLEEFTKTTAGELTLKAASTTRQQALEILNSIEKENEVFENLSLDNESTPDDYDVDANAEEAQSIKITKEQIDNIVGEDSKRIARFLSKLTLDQIKSLVKVKKDGTMDYSGIETLKSVLKNIQNGFVTQGAIKLKMAVNINKGTKTVSDVVTKKATKANILRNIRNSAKKVKAYFRNTSVIFERMRGGPLFNIDDIIGNFNSKTVYRTVLSPLQKAYETYRGETNKLFAKVEAADKQLEFDGIKKPRKWFSMGRSRNAIVKAKAKIAMFQFQREHLSNFVDGKPNKKAPSAIEFVNATLKKLKINSRVNQKQIDIITEVANEFTVDGKISLEKIEKSFTKAEKNYLAAMDELNNSQAEKALYISTMHGNQVDLYNNYVHHATIGERAGSKKAFSALDEMAKRYESSINGKTKSGTIESRTDGPSAVSFDPSYSVKRGLQATNMDYYMTETLKEVAGIVGKVSDGFANNPESTATQTQVSSALQKAVDEVNRNVFLNSFNDIGPMGKFIESAKRLGYQAALASIARGGAEFIGNVQMFLKNPVTGMKAIKNFTGMTLLRPSTVYDAATNLKSGVTTKLADADVLKGKYSNMSDMGMPTRRTGEAVSTIENILGMVKRFTGLPQYAGVVNKIANKVLSFPDQVLSRPLWFQTYSDAFAQATGIKLTSKDFKKIAEGDSKYLGPEFQEARNIAVDKADNAIVVMSTSNNPYDGILKIMPSPEDGAATSYLKAIDGFLARYSLFEFGNANHAFMALFNKGEMSKVEAAAMLTGTTMRMGTYMVAYATLTRLLDDEIFGAVDERKEDDDIEDLLVRQMIGSIMTLVFGGNSGNLSRLPINFALEYGINEPLLEDFRDGKYNPYVHSMVFSQLSMEDIQKGDLLEIFTKVGLGPAGPAFNSLRRALLVGTKSQTSAKPETREKYKKELEERILIEALGNTGMLPFYKDIRRIILKNMFGKKEKTAAERKAEADYIKNQQEVLKDLGVDLDLNIDTDLDIDTDFDTDIDFDL